jgi:hypothetical protein
MITKTQYSVPLDLIEKSLEQLPRIDFRVSLNMPTGNFFYDPWEIKPEFKNTIWAEILSALPLIIGEARIIKLEPGTGYFSHADIDDRWHLSLTGVQSYLIDITSQQMHLLKKDGFWYDMDAGKIHTAANFGQIPRYQLVIRKLLINGVTENLKLIRIDPAYDHYDYRYQFDNIVSPWLNYASKNGHISNFKFDNLSVSFNLDEARVPDFKRIITENFKVTYE